MPFTSVTKGASFSAAVRFVEAEAPDGTLRRGLVAYSLGNFISNMTVRYTDSGMILDFTLRECQDGGITVENVRCVPIYCWKGDDMIRAVSSLKYDEERPEGMSSGIFSRMKESCRELQELLGPEIEMIAE